MRIPLVMYALMNLCTALAAPDGNAPTVIHRAPLDASRPLFIPTHPRVTTTIRFPGAIGAPDGAVSIFTEDAARSPAEYLVTWQSGDAYFTVSPLREAPLANLNVPFGSETYVFYFYGVTDPLKAVASVILGDAPAGAAVVPSPAAATPPLLRQHAPPARSFVAATPARLLGFIDRLKLIHAAAVGPDLASMAQAMGVQIAVTREQVPAGSPAGNDMAGVAVIDGGINDGGLFELILLRVVRDRRLNCLGFICLLRNTSPQPLTFDVNSFGARAGAEYLAQRISDAPAQLAPGEQSPAYFVVQAPANSPLLAANAWRLSLDLVSPQLNPGAALARLFPAAAPTP